MNPLGWFKKDKKPKEKETREDMLKEFGIRVIKDERLEQRLVFNKDISEYIQQCEKTGKTESPENFVKLIEEQATEVNKKIHQIAIPFMRAGDVHNGVYGLIATRYNSLYTKKILLYTSIVYNAITRLNTRGANKADEQKIQSAQKLHAMFVRYYLKYAHDILTISWKSEDVTNQYTALIQSPLTNQQRDMGRAFEDE